jgi:hypothetical protein
MASIADIKAVLESRKGKPKKSPLVAVGRPVLSSLAVLARAIQPNEGQKKP